MTPPPLQVLIEPYLGLIERHFWIEGSLALIAALIAIALRRQRRLFKAPGFIMLSVGLIIDMMSPQAPQKYVVDGCISERADWSAYILICYCVCKEGRRRLSGR